MAMKETERSLKAYFVLVGIVGGAAAASNLRDCARLPDGMPASWKLALLLPAVAHLLLAIAFLIAGVKLTQALASDPTWIKRMLVVAGVTLVAEVVLTQIVFGDLNVSAMQSAVSSMYGRNAIGLLITWYLHRSVSRLSRESKGRVTSVFE